jgi:hypothetical protein
MCFELSGNCDSNYCRILRNLLKVLHPSTNLIAATINTPQVPKNFKSLCTCWLYKNHIKQQRGQELILGIQFSQQFTMKLIFALQNAA